MTGNIEDIKASVIQGNAHSQAIVQQMQVIVSEAEDLGRHAVPAMREAILKVRSLVESLRETRNRSAQEAHHAAIDEARQAAVHYGALEGTQSPHLINRSAAALADDIANADLRIVNDEAIEKALAALSAAHEAVFDIYATVADRAIEQAKPFAQRAQRHVAMGEQYTAML